MVAGGRFPVRVALAWGVLAGLATLLAMPLVQPEQVALASDAYYHATRAFLAGENPYLAESTPAGVAPFVYPPAVLLLFLPHVLAGSPAGAYAVQLLLNLVTIGTLAYLLLAVTDSDGLVLARLDRALVVGFVALSPHATTVLVMGQVNLQLSLALAVGAVVLERGRDRLAGAAVALAAGVKLFPAAVGLWFLGLRRVRAVAAATATGLATLLVGAVLVDRATLLTYATEVLPGQTQTGEFAGGLPPDAMYVTVRRPIAALLPDIDPVLYFPLALVVLVPLVLASYRVLAGRDGRRTALLATLLGTLVALPLEGFYFSLVYFPLVPLLFGLDPGRPRQLLAVGTLLLSTPVSALTIRRTADVLALPDAIAAPIDGLGAIMTVVQPQLVGTLVILAGCALYHHRAVTGGP
jgi:hypothetical protein